MNKKYFSTFFLFFLFVGLHVGVPANAFGGKNIVGEEDRSWAKEVLEQEKTLGAVGSPNSVAVLYFDNKSEESELDLLEKGLAIMLITDLYKIKKIKLVERAKIQALKDEMDLGGISKREQKVHYGKLLGVEHLIGGDILKGQVDEFRLKSEMMKVPTEKIFAEPETHGKLLDSLFAMEKDLLFQIIAQMNIQLTNEEEALLRENFTNNLQAFIYFMEGIDHADRGDHQKANEFFKKAIGEDPLLGKVLEDDPSYVEAYEPPEDTGTDDDNGTDSPGEDKGDPSNDFDPNDEDNDGDGFTENQNDCNDNDPSINPGAIEIRCDFIDNDCNSATEDDPDEDDDGVSYCSGDCDDTNPDLDCNPFTPMAYDNRFTTPVDGGQPPGVDQDSWNLALASAPAPEELEAPGNGWEFRPGLFNLAESWENPSELTKDWGYYWYFLDGPGYEPGLQVIGVDDETGVAKLFLSQATVDEINTYTGPDAPDFGFLAYAVQAEEDRLNQRILEMCQAEAEGQLLADINWQLESGNIRSRDDFMLQKADAQAGRVLKDHEGNWVRVQQYVLRPNSNTVQVLSVSLRGPGTQHGLSTIDFTTRFTEEITDNLGSLPWDEYLDTQWGMADSVKWIDYRGDAFKPELASMSVEFKNPGGESLKESRAFGLEVFGSPIENSGDTYYQVIQNEQLTVATAGGDETYEFNWGESPGIGGYITSDNGNGFAYEFYYQDVLTAINVDFFVLGDAETSDNVGEIGGYEETADFEDIWDALSVNESYSGYIGFNNLEIVIDADRVIFSNPIDVVYIPMSRMLWKDGWESELIAQ